LKGNNQLGRLGEFLKEVGVRTQGLGKMAQARLMGMVLNEADLVLNKKDQERLDLARDMLEYC
jgi:hypothetical protein